MLTITSEYAIRALSCLAGSDEGVLLGRELSELAAVPSTYLSKIMLSLRNAGFVKARRGSGGGYELARPAKSICLISIVELFEGDRARPGCVLGLAECSERNPCPAHNSWTDLRLRYIAFLEKTTLADIAAKGHLKKRMRRI
jgi:Rrf2 family transcriptional regulator, iron-sulfur cluster assembly transcription factor